jgi:hypothetical protein
MNNPRTLQIVIVALVIALITSLGFLSRALWQNLFWEQEAFGLAGMVATKQAKEDFQAGRLRLRVIVGENERLRYSGSNDGPFEIWFPQFYPSLGEPHRFSVEQAAAFYNRKMRFMQDHPEQFTPTTNSELQISPRDDVVER